MSKADELLEGVNMEQDIKILEEFCGALAEQYLDQIVCDESELYQAIKNIIKAYKDLEDIKQAEKDTEIKLLRKAISNLIAENKELDKFIKEGITIEPNSPYKNFQLNYLRENFIPKSKVEEEIDKLNKKEKDLQNSISDEEREEYSDANISFDLMDIDIRRETLQSLLGKE